MPMSRCFGPGFVLVGSRDGSAEPNSTACRLLSKKYCGTQSDWEDPRFPIMWMLQDAKDSSSSSTMCICAQVSHVWSAVPRFGASSLADGELTIVRNARNESTGHR